MPNLKEVIDMFGEFGFTESTVRQALGAGNSAHNAFEGLKICLELKWADMNQELGTERLKALKPLYETLMGLKMTGRKTGKDVKKKRKARTRDLTDDLMGRLDQRKRKNVEAFLGTLGKDFRKMDKEGKLDAATKDRIRASGLGEIWKD